MEISKVFENVHILASNVFSLKDGDPFFSATQHYKEQVEDHTSYRNVQNSMYIVVCLSTFSDC